MKTNTHFFIALLFFALNISLYASDIVPLDNLERHTAFANAAHRAIPQWVTGRLKPVAIVTLLYAPSLLLELLGSPLATTQVLLPITAGIMARQFLLINRDVNLYNSFSAPHQHLQLDDFPPKHMLDEMDNHHQILNELAEYTRKNGTYREKASLLIPGFRGYTKQKKLDFSIIKFNKKGP